jgi:uncharacterized protein YgiM (DUF1202 family)
MKLYSLVFFFVLPIFLALFETSTLAQYSDFWLVVQKNANIRVGPGTSFAIVDKVPAGTILRSKGYPLIDERGFVLWYPVGEKSPPKKWIYAKLVRIFVSHSQASDAVRNMGSTQPPRQASKMAWLVAVKNGNIRGGPGLDYPVVQKAHVGDVFEIKGKPAYANHGAVSWYPIEVDEKSLKYTKWIYRTLVKSFATIHEARQFSPLPVEQKKEKPRTEPPHPSRARGVELSNAEITVAHRDASSVKISWIVVANSSSAISGCRLRLSFRNDEGLEIHSVSEAVDIEEGANSITGNNTCDPKVWNQTDAVRAQLDCQIPKGSAASALNERK